MTSCRLHRCRTTARLHRSGSASSCRLLCRGGSTSRRLHRVACGRPSASPGSPGPCATLNKLRWCEWLFPLNCCWCYIVSSHRDRQEVDSRIQTQEGAGQLPSKSRWSQSRITERPLMLLHISVVQNRQYITRCCFHPSLPLYLATDKKVIIIW